MLHMPLGEGVSGMVEKERSIDERRSGRTMLSAFHSHQHAWWPISKANSSLLCKHSNGV